MACYKYPFKVQNENNNKIYQCEAFIGKGAYGEVHKCYKTGCLQILAIKFIDLQQYEEIERIEREAKLLRKIQSFDHVIKILDNFKDQKNYYIITEFMAGGNLGQFIKSREHLSLDQSAYFLQQIALGVNEIHSRGIIHRDLKPDNILLSNDGQNITLKITDFGLSNQQNLANSNVGSPVYSAPEQHEKGKKQTYSIDIWSLGTILYEMVIGTEAFPAEE